MREIIDTIKYKGYTIEIYPDELALDPIENNDYLGTIVTWHNNYQLGHEQPKYNPDDWLRDKAIEANPDLESVFEYWEDGNGWIHLNNVFSKQKETKNIISNQPYKISDEIIKEHIQKTIEKYYIFLPVYMYDHSGITIRTGPFNDPWDSGQLGYIYVSKEKVRKEMEWKKITKERIEKIKDILRSEIKEYDNYLTGSVYYYEIIDPDTEESINSCGNFFGYNWKENGLEEYAYNEIDCDISKKDKEKTELIIKEIGKIQLEGSLDEIEASLNI